MTSKNLVLQCKPHKAFAIKYGRKTLDFMNIIYTAAIDMSANLLALPTPLVLLLTDADLVRVRLSGDDGKSPESTQWT